MFAHLVALILLAAQSDSATSAQDRAIHYLIENQHSDGSWTLPSNERFSHAGAAFLGFAMLRAGLPPEHSALHRVDQLLRKYPPRSTYGASVRVQFLDALRPVDLQQRLQRCADALKLPKADYYGYGYTPTLPYGDLSNHQFALLAWEILDQHGLGPGKRVWSDFAELLMRQQAPDGGWGYFLASESTPTMHLAGLACLAACERALVRNGAPSSLLRATAEALERGFESASESWYLDAERSSAPLRRWIHYAGATLERAASLSGRSKIGELDWHQEITDFLHATQRANGSWSSGKGEPVLNTGLALATLARATASTGSNQGSTASWQYRWSGQTNRAIRIVASGTQPCTAFISSIGSDLGDGARLAAVEWSLHGEPLGQGVGPRGTIQFEVPGNGRFKLHATARIQFDHAESELADEQEYEAEIELRVTGLVDDRCKRELDWLRRSADLLQQAELDLETSSQRGGDSGAGWAHDGSLGTSWRWGTKDAEPSWKAELNQAVRCMGVRIVPHLASKADHESESTSVELRLRVNGKRIRLIPGNSPEGVYHAFTRPTRVHRLSVSIVHPAQKMSSDWIGIREIQLIEP